MQNWKLDHHYPARTGLLWFFFKASPSVEYQYFYVALHTWENRWNKWKIMYAVVKLGNLAKVYGFFWFWYLIWTYHFSRGLFSYSYNRISFLWYAHSGWGWCVLLWEEHVLIKWPKKLVLSYGASGCIDRRDMLDIWRKLGIASLLELCKRLSSLWRGELVLCGLDFPMIFDRNPHRNLLKKLCNCIMAVAFACIRSLLISTDVKYMVSSIGKDKSSEDWRGCCLLPKSQQEKVP